MRLLDLPHVLRSAGQTVIEVDGWQQRGKELNTLTAIICHHTASGPTWPNDRVARLLRDGRVDLPGPLAQLGLDRDGHWWLVAAGKANHNGYGKYGNQTIGIEAYNDGVGEPWPEVQVSAWAQGCAALCAHFGIPVDRVLGHKEVDPTRKVDPKGLDMGWFRQQVAKPATPDVEEMASLWLLSI